MNKKIKTQKWKYWLIEDGSVVKDGSVDVKEGSVVEDGSVDVEEGSVDVEDLQQFMDENNLKIKMIIFI